MTTESNSTEAAGGEPDQNLGAAEKLAAMPATPLVPKARNWQYVIFHLDGGVVEGTNDFEVAKAFAASEIHQVLHLPTSQLMNVLDDGTPEHYNIPETAAG